MPVNYIQCKRIDDFLELDVDAIAAGARDFDALTEALFDKGI